MDPGHGEVQGRLLVRRQVEVGQVVVLGPDDVADLLGAVDGHRRDLDAAVAQGPLVALEGLAPRLALGRVPGHLGRDLAQRLGPLVAQQHEHQVGQPLEPVHHGRERRRRHARPDGVAPRARVGAMTPSLLAAGLPRPGRAPWRPLALHLHPVAWLAIAAVALAYGLAVRRPGAARRPPAPLPTRRQLLVPGRRAGGPGAGPHLAPRRPGRPLVAHRPRRPAPPAHPGRGPAPAARHARRRSWPCSPDPPPLDACLEFVTRPVVAVVTFTVVAVGTLVTPAVAAQASSAVVARPSPTWRCSSAGAVLWGPVLRHIPGAHRTVPVGIAAYLFVQSVVPTFPAVIYVFARHPLYGALRPRPRGAIGISPLVDQQLAGVVAKVATLPGPVERGVGGADARPARRRRPPTATTASPSPGPRSSASSSAPSAPSARDAPARRAGATPGRSRAPSRCPGPTRDRRRRRSDDRRPRPGRPIAGRSGETAADRRRGHPTPEGPPRRSADGARRGRDGGSAPAPSRARTVASSTFCGVETTTMAKCPTPDGGARPGGSLDLAGGGSARGRPPRTRCAAAWTSAS